MNGTYSISETRLHVWRRPCGASVLKKHEARDVIVARSAEALVKGVLYIYLFKSLLKPTPSLLFTNAVLLEPPDVCVGG